MNENFFWESLQDPFVLEGFECGHAIDWVPVQAQVDEFKELSVLTLLKHVLQSLSVRQSATAA